MEKVIECKHLTHYYGQKMVFEDMNFSVPSGRVLGLLGKNGTGKTTTINILHGFLQPRKGECLIFGENTQSLQPETKARIGYLIEGHIQYSFMNVNQIERFYSSFYPNWKRDAYYGLIEKLQITPKQRIANMSCGQRSQIALGLILAQDPDLLILDDFSMGLDPGYRRLFIDYLKEYMSYENKTVFVTSHIIQDMEYFIDDLMIMDYGKGVVMQQPVADFMGKFKQYTLSTEAFDALPDMTDKQIIRIEKNRDNYDVFTYLSKEELGNKLKEKGISVAQITEKKMSLEDAFVGLTGKY